MARFEGCDNTTHEATAGCMHTSFSVIHPCPTTSGARATRWMAQKVDDAGLWRGWGEFVWDDEEKEGAVGFRGQAIM